MPDFGESVLSGMRMCNHTGGCQVDMKKPLFGILMFFYRRRELSQTF